jgi:hypothetical protein
MKLQRSDLGEHLKSECEYRNLKCEYCGQDVTFASIKVSKIKYLIENYDLIFNHKITGQTEAMFTLSEDKQLPRDNSLTRGSHHHF